MTITVTSRSEVKYGKLVWYTDEEGNEYVAEILREDIFRYEYIIRLLGSETELRVSIDEIEDYDD